MTKIVIERGIAVLPAGTGRPRMYPFPDMEVSDSFSIPLSGETHPSGGDVAVQRLRSAADSYARKYGGQYVVRTDRETNKARCWRIA